MERESYTAGYVRLHRKTLGSRVMGDPIAFYVWHWCLLKACYKPYRWRGLTLEPGQFVTGKRSGSAELQIPQSTFWGAIARLRDWGQLDTHTDRRGTVVTVVHWETYQSSEDGTPTAARPEAVQAPSRGRPEAVQAPTLEKKVNNNKKEKKYKNHGFFKILPEELLDTAAEDRLHLRMVAEGIIDGSEDMRVKFLATIEHCRRAKDPPAMLAKAVRCGYMEFATQAEEQAAMSKRKKRQVRSGMEL